MAWRLLICNQGLVSGSCSPPIDVKFLRQIGLHQDNRNDGRFVEIPIGRVSTLSSPENSVTPGLPPCSDLWVGILSLGADLLTKEISIFLWDSP